MKVTRDVIADLWPIYDANEASPETRELVEEFLRGDPAFRQELGRLPDLTSLPSMTPAPPADAERTTLTMTKKLLRREKLLLVLAILTAMIPPATTEAHLHFSAWGITTRFDRLPAWENFLALACLAVSLGLWGAWFHLWRRLRVKGF